MSKRPPKITPHPTHLPIDPTSRGLTDQEIRASAWVARNRGVVSRLARTIRPKVSVTFVHLVLRGQRKSEDGKVERALRLAGAPVD